MKNIWSVLCSRAIIDQRSNSLSLFNCLDELTITFPSPEAMAIDNKNVPLVFEVVSLWHDEESKETDRILSYVIEIYDPQGVKLGEFKNQAKFEAGKTRLRAITGINGMKLSTEGQYVFKIYEQVVDELRLEAEIPLNVRFLVSLPNANSK